MANCKSGRTSPVYPVPASIICADHLRGKQLGQAAQMLREMEVDILVDLGGYTSDTRTDILSFRPAPVQVNYLGYPGTMGVEYYDYILADRHIIPAG